MCTPVFIAALFSIAKTWKEPKCPATDDWLRKMWYVCMHAKLLQLCLILCHPTGHSPPGSSVHGILQAGILKWVAVPSSRGSSQPRNHTQVSCSPALASGFFTTNATWEVHSLTIICLGPHNGVWGFNYKLLFISSQFWRLEVQYQDASRVSFW